MSCSRCGGLRVASISAKSNDSNTIELQGVEKHDYVPDDMGIGGGDYVRFSWCLDCGTIQGINHLPVCTLEEIDQEEGE